MIKLDEFFHLLSDETRLRCLMLIQAKGELCVCDFTNVLKQIQPKISRHLAILRKHNVVSDRRDGIWIYYSIHPKLPKWARKILSTTLGQIANEKPFSSDLKLLEDSNNCSPCCD